MSLGKSLSYINEAYIFSLFLVVEHLQVIQYLEKAINQAPSLEKL